MKLAIFEILDLAAKQDKIEDRAAVLQKHYSPVLEQLLQMAFDKDLVWALPDGDPPYEPNQAVDQHGRLYAEFRKFYLFFEEHSPHVKPLKRESLWIQMLEMLEPEEAKLLCDIKSRRLGRHPKYKKITKGVLAKAFPGNPFFQSLVKTRGRPKAEKVQVQGEGPVKKTKKAAKKAKVAKKKATKSNDTQEEKQ